ncbi:hypothetical protein PoB_005627300 [Plakobranchus ocellatus]|uniref:Uncharacterized protein n=1 Tax=Plakobranchus ocellatus TaxID=259542 RepID=A0AAV4CD06_9GAST|nr:hypothetical protein PoB_005627300 [Plakobranchus ocellatus]
MRSRPLFLSDTGGREDVCPSWKRQVGKLQTVSLSPHHCPDTLILHYVPLTLAVHRRLKSASFSTCPLEDAAVTLAAITRLTGLKRLNPARSNPRSEIPLRESVRAGPTLRLRGRR